MSALASIIFALSFFSSSISILAKLGLKVKCSSELMTEKKCEVDEFVGTDLLYEDLHVRIWSPLTLAQER